MAKETAGKVVSKNNKKPAVPRKSPSKFFKEMSSELKKVSWPNRKELTNFTIAVIAFILVIAAIVGVVDLGLTQLMNLIIR